jgi:hypothetical protein
VVDCTAMSNDGFGIIVFDASTVQRCTASNNRGGAGMHAENRSQVIGCVANANGNPSGATGHGIRMGLRGIVKQSTATQNRADGISVAGESVVVENRASQNGAGSGSAGIRTTNQSGSGSRVEANHIRDNNGAGIIASGADVVIRNTAGNNSPFGNYCDILLNPLSGPNVGPIGTVASTAHPAANYQ